MNNDKIDQNQNNFSTEQIEMFMKMMSMMNNQNQSAN